MAIITSQIKVRQISPTELSGFVNGTMFSSLSGTGINIGGNIISTGSGLYSLGGTNHYFKNLYTNNINIPSGSGIMFGNTSLTAFTSGNAGVLNVGGYTITSSATALSIIGPSGPSGLQGIQGITGNSGVGITGYTTSNNQLTFYYSNGTSGNALQLPSGATGATGAFATGSIVSGNYISFVFSNGSTGASFYIPSGEQGEQGPVGNIYYDFGVLSNYTTGDPQPPLAYFPDVNPSITENPPLNFVKGMDYGIGYSGLSTYLMSGYIPTNYYVDDWGQTGYLQLVFFTSDAVPGRYISGQTLTTGYSDIANLLDTVNLHPISTNRTFNTYINQMSMSVGFDSDELYYYGFQRYSMALQAPIDGDSVPGEWGFYILGQANTSYFGPAGPSGAAGLQGIPGPQGDIGLNGIDGPVGIGITGVTSNGASLQLGFSDGSTSQWITLPQGGAQGETGPQGPSGLQGLPGPTGATGAQGYADTYFAEFYPNDMQITGNVGINKQVSGASTWVLCQGNNRTCQPGDKIWFNTPSLVGKAYSPWQNIIFADNDFSNARYFYASVVSFNNNNGEMQCVVNSNPSPVGMVGGYNQLYNYSLIDMNLGGLGSSGAIGPQGIQGPMGNTGYAIFQNTFSHLSPNDTTTVNPGSYDSWNFDFTGEYNTINILSNTFSTGQTLIIKVRNTGSLNATENSLLFWQVNSSGNVLKFPYNIPPPAPDPNNASIYTFLRFVDENNLPSIYCTFSANYPD